MWDLFFTVAGTDFNEAWYKCFLYYDDISTTYLTKWAGFNDFGDIYLSFIFNMLSNSLNIKSQTENMIASYETHDTVTFVQSLGSILRSIIDFDSYTSVAGSNKTPSVDEFYGFTRTVAQDIPMWERKANQDKRREDQQARMADRVEVKEMEVNGSKILLRSSKINPLVKLAEGY